MKFIALAIGTGAFHESKFTDISTAATAVIGTRTGQNLGPALLAQIFIAFADTFAAINTYCRPKKLV